MRLLMIFILFMPFQILFGQETQKSIIKSGTTKTKDKSLYFENDIKGNMIFSLNEGMNGPITMIFASEYDSLNRETRSYWVHSNLGFYLSEKVYEKGCVKNFEYKSISDSTFSYDRETLKKIKTRDDFTKMKIFIELGFGSKVLSKIDYLDSADNVIKEIYLSESGDTTSINHYEYNANNQEIFFHYGTIGDESWTWDIYYLYDEHNNKVKSYRISSSNGIKDTTEVYNYIYNSDNRLISDNYYYKEAFRNKTDYYYNKRSQIIQELFCEGNENKIDVKTTFKYDRKGNVKKKVQYDYRNPKNEQKEVFITKFEYW